MVRIMVRLLQPTVTLLRRMTDVGEESTLPEKGEEDAASHLRFEADITTPLHQLSDPAQQRPSPA